MRSILLAAATASCALASASLASAQVSTFYFSDFEGTDGGFVSGGVGDWERGTPSPYVPANEPPSRTSGNGGINDAFSGDELWATNLDGSHTNPSPTAASTLQQTFDFSSLLGPITLSFQHYLNSGSNSFDMATVQVNGTTLALYSGTEGSFNNGGTPGDASDDTVIFAPALVDLSAFAGQSSVLLDFNFLQTTVVARDGWYIDDVRIVGVVPEPASLSLLGLGGLTLLRRRR